ncbi:HNH endonuclease [Massilia aurea]|uniref:HNH endonuclease n=1 Tax=Massilia aurea TaxID=373040 RepID=UPI000F2DD7C7|nr:HNH endonuclease [Massilia aurea]
MSIPTRKIIKHDLVKLLSEIGPLTTIDVYSSLAEKWQLTHQELSSKRSGASLYQNEIRWARQELAIEGIIARPSESGRAVWRMNTGICFSKSISPDDIDTSASYPEGATKTVSVNAYERSNEARKKCLEHYGYRCIVCALDFESIYGAIGKGCIHVHHLVEISSIGAEYQVDPLNDLVPICPNCHYIAHQRRPAFTVKELKSMIATNARKSST